jgi:hypothetical protein
MNILLLMREKRGPGTKEPSPKRPHNTILSPQNAGGVSALEYLKISTKKVSEKVSEKVVRAREWGRSAKIRIKTRRGRKVYLAAISSLVATTTHTSHPLPGIIPASSVFLHDAGQEKFSQKEMEKSNISRFDSPLRRERRSFAIATHPFYSGA